MAPPRIGPAACPIYWHACPRIEHRGVLDSIASPTTYAGSTFPAFLAGTSLASSMPERMHWGKTRVASGPLPNAQESNPMRPFLLAVAFLALLGGCATTNDGGSERSDRHPKIYGPEIYGHCR